MDGASCKVARGVVIVIKGLNAVVIEYALRLTFKVTNNGTEYETLIKGLDLGKKIEPRRLNVYSDS